MQKFELIVIGNGSGLDVANAAVEHGQKVAIIEKDRRRLSGLNLISYLISLLTHLNS